MGSKEIVICENAQEIAQRAAERFARLAHKAISRSGCFAVALSGGNTPRAVNANLADHYREALDWPRIFLFWGDERPVPPDHKESNFRMARESLIDHVAIPDSNIFRILSELPPAEAARRYETELRRFFRTDKEKFPSFDLIFLGMGDDGHTASLFPGTPALAEQTRWVVSNPVEKLNTERITLTAPVINHAREVIVLVSGAAKAPALKQVLKGELQPKVYPSQLIRPRGRLVWLVDEAAASQLN
ncbi:MAG TPA: 6-phosphogluconolactonase [Acidobacteriota bacterium]|jgi:6-phosphogluconolactonase|nr:6-phosphogluconolactonase [Acidobacteriota bacterium]